MMDKPENPRAFPKDHTISGYDGMTLRDWFAGLAIIGTASDYSFGMSDDATKNCVNAAYRISDAMLAERTKP